MPVNVGAVEVSEDESVFMRGTWRPGALCTAESGRTCYPNSISQVGILKWPNSSMISSEQSPHFSCYSRGIGVSFHHGSQEIKDV